jgi:hypothetical protein
MPAVEGGRGPTAACGGVGRPGCRARRLAVLGLGSWPTTATAAGRPLDEVTDPFALEVYRTVQPENPPSGAAGRQGFYQR